MLFNSAIFIFLFLPICLAGFYALYSRQNTRWITWLNLCSVVFYGYWSLSHLGIFLISISVNYLLSKPVGRCNKTALAAGIMFNLALLGYFKYANFMIDQINTLSGAQIDWLKVVLPIGISFFTFQQIAYLIDSYQQKAKPVPFRKYFFFVSFFPQLIAGPIVHHAEIFPQLGRVKNHARNLAVGLSIFAFGLFKKVVIADTIALSAGAVFGYAESGGAPTLIEAWTGALAYALQIYFDFSAYSDMAIGLARMFGLRLPQNFASPYKSASIIEFWRRWHITLSRFLRDYLYIPLGGNRKGPARRYLNVMLTMLIGGFWHGAGWNFILWGGLHGAFLVINQAAQGLMKIPRPVGWALTFACVTFAWVPFRAVNMEGTLNMWKGMLCFNGLVLPDRLDFIARPLGLRAEQLLSGVNAHSTALILALIALCVLAPNVAEIFRRARPVLLTPSYPQPGKLPRFLQWRPTIGWALALMILFMLSVLKLGDPSEFLYFQF